MTVIRAHRPDRHDAVMDSLRCSICGAPSYQGCDLTAHAAFATSRYGCSACGATPGEVCALDCTAADTLTDVIGVLRAL